VNFASLIFLSPLLPEMNLTLLNPSFICSQNNGAKLWNVASLILRGVYNNCGIVRSTENIDEVYGGDCEFVLSYNKNSGN
jgi:hypothetical protein